MHVARWMVAVVVGLIVVAALPARGLSFSADDAAASLLGSWRVRVDGSDRPRLLTLHKVNRSSDETAVLDGRYGWFDTRNPARVVVTVTRDANGFAVEFSTSDARIRLRQETGDQLRGTFEGPKRTVAVVVDRETATTADAPRAEQPVPAAGAEGSLDNLIVKAGMAPWRGRPINLDDPLLRADGTEARLREFLDGRKPLVVYMYGVW